MVGAFGGRQGTSMGGLFPRGTAMSGSNLSVNSDILKQLGGDPEATKKFINEAVAYQLKTQKRVYDT